MDNIYNIIADLLGKIFNEIRTTSAEYQVKVNCPKCARLFNNYEVDNKFNLEINYKKRLYHCWKCGVKGRLRNLFKFYGNHELYSYYVDNVELDFIGVDENNNEDFSFELFEIVLPKEFISFRDYSEFDDRFIEPFNYLTQTRKLNLETIQKYNMGFCISGKYKDRIVVPFYDNNNILNYFITRSYKSGSYLNPFAEKNIIPNEGLIDWNCKIYLVEGFFDYLALPFNTIILNGKIINNLLYEKLKKYKPPVCIALDYDAKKNVLEMSDILFNIGIHDVTYIKFNKDSDIDEIKKELTHDEYINFLKCNTKPINDEEKLYNINPKKS